MNKESLTRRAALGLLAGSGTLLVSDSLAITEIDASRGVNVDTAADSDALLGLTDASEGAEISGESETATVYEISDNVGSLSESNIDVTVLSLIRGDESETKITTPPVEATVRSTGGAQFAVDVSCASETDTLGGSYKLVLDFGATTDNLSVTATRTTSSSVPISCTFDYGNSGNYTDASNDGAAQPENPSGNIETPSAVNEIGGDTATAVSSSSNADLKVGYALPPVDEAATTYALRVIVASITVKGNGNQGSFGFYLVNEGGDQLTDRQVLRTGDETYEFTSSNEEDIAANADNLVLIIDSKTEGKATNKIEIDYFSLVSN